MIDNVKTPERLIITIKAVKYVFPLKFTLKDKVTFSSIGSTALEVNGTVTVRLDLECFSGKAALSNQNKAKHSNSHNLATYSDTTAPVS